MLLWDNNILWFQGPEVPLRVMIIIVSEAIPSTLPDCFQNNNVNINNPIFSLLLPTRFKSVSILHTRDGYSYTQD